MLSGGLNLYVLFVILLPRDEKNEQYYQLPGLAFATITSDLENLRSPFSVFGAITTSAVYTEFAEVHALQSLT